MAATLTPLLLTNGLSCRTKSTAKSNDKHGAVFSNLLAGHAALRVRSEQLFATDNEVSKRKTISALFNSQGSSVVGVVVAVVVSVGASVAAVLNYFTKASRRMCAPPSSTQSAS